MFGFDPIAKIADYTAGDWVPLAQTGIAIGNVADTVHDIGLNVQVGMLHLNGDWEGNAANAASIYFTDTANRVAEWQDPLKEIARQYEIIGHGVASTTDAIEGLIKFLLDMALIAGIAFAAGTATAETGIGPIVGYGMGAIAILEMLAMWDAATQLMSFLYTVVQGAAGIIETKIADLDASSIPELSTGGNGYDHPLAEA